MARHSRSGEGSVYRRKSDGRWVASLRVEGKTHTAYCQSKAEARRQLEEMKQARYDGKLTPQSDMQVGSFLDFWLQHIVRDRVKPSTHANYALNVSRLKPYIGRVKLMQLRAGRIDAAYGQLRENALSPTSVSQAHRVLRAALRYAVRAGYLHVNPMEGVTSPRATPREMQVLTAEQATQLIRRTADDQLHALWVLLLSTGVRVGEATALTWADIDLDGGRLTVRYTLHRVPGEGMLRGPAKTRSSRRGVRLGQVAVQALQYHRDRQLIERRTAAEAWEDSGLVFCTRTGQPLDPGYVRQVLHRALQAAGLPIIRVHDLRHTCASLLLSEGTHPKVVQEMLGHSSIQVTMDVYSHVAPQLHAQAASTMDGLLTVSRPG